MKNVTALAGWYGSNRMGAANVGNLLARCSWVGIPFAGGMSEVPCITARSILVNDLHRHIINLARVAADDALRPQLIRQLKRKLFHPDELYAAQRTCRLLMPGDAPDLGLAEAYFACCWMGRASKAGGKDEFNGRPSIRWNADGGDSVTRYRSAIRMLAATGREFRRCQFETMDAFDCIGRMEDRPDHGCYCDPPFPEVGRHYKHNAGMTDGEEREWHTRLRDAAQRFEKTTVVMRFYDHPLIRELYPTGQWEWRHFDGRTQANADSPEILLVRNRQADLFNPPTT